MPFITFADVQAHLDTLGLFHMDMGLHRMDDALRALGLCRPPFAVAHVVGTNGKGSTSTFLASIAKAHGVRCGLYTSPHFVTPRERIRINGHMLPEALWPQLCQRVHDVAPQLTYFELLTVLAVLAFAGGSPVSTATSDMTITGTTTGTTAPTSMGTATATPYPSATATGTTSTPGITPAPPLLEPVQLAVMEAGLGGRHDATTALAADVVCYTPIGMDHERILGNTLSAIATDKAGAMRHRVPAITGQQEPEALRALHEAAAQHNAPLHTAAAIATLPPNATLGLAGPHQQQNALLALAAWTTLATANGWPIDDAATRRGLAAAFIPGRLQNIPASPKHGHPQLLLDGAHNAHGLAALQRALAAQNIQPRAVIFSCLADKNLAAIAPHLLALAGKAPLIIPTIADNERAASGHDLAAHLGQQAQAVPRLTDALQIVASQAATTCPDAPVLLCGSLYLLAEFFTLRPDCLTSPTDSTP